MMAKTIWKRPDGIVFRCRKCGHRLILRITGDDTLFDILKRIEAIAEMDCPECGEEAYENWILSDVYKEETDG